jgi:gluconolactonase
MKTLRCAQLSLSEFEVLTAGLLFPEGPVALSDGSTLLVDILSGTLLQVAPGGDTFVIARLAGGPNGAALGPDGKLYVCNNGGLAWRRAPDGHVVIRSQPPEHYHGGWIERVDLRSGFVERLHEKVNGEPLSSPNDLVFDRHGGYWFTDTGKTVGRQRHVSSIYYAPADGSEPIEAVRHGISFNGIGLSAQEHELYAADTYSATLWAYTLRAPGRIDETVPARVVVRMPRTVWFDSLAVLENGHICVGMVLEGGIAEVSPEGRISVTRLPDKSVTNICFGGADRCDAYITLSSTGRLIRMRWPTPGLRLNFSI